MNISILYRRPTSLPYAPNSNSSLHFESTPHRAVPNAATLHAAARRRSPYLAPPFCRRRQTRGVASTWTHRPASHGPSRRWPGLSTARLPLTGLDAADVMPVTGLVALPCAVRPVPRCPPGPGTTRPRVVLPVAGLASAPLAPCWPLFSEVDTPPPRPSSSPAPGPSRPRWLPSPPRR
jgi:hypothetical protein